MNESRLISILLPFYNEEQYINQCIESIMDQTYTSWELIAVDDQSTDNSPKMVERLAKIDHRIRCIRNDKKGVIGALQTAFSASKGELITRMDADDYKSRDNLELLASCIDRSGQLATGMVKYFSNEREGLQDGYIRYAEWLNETIENETCFNHVFKECTIPSPAWMVHREDLIRVRGFQSDLYPEDYDLCLRFYRAGLEIRSVKKVIHYWRDHGRRVTRNDTRYADNFFIDLKLPYFLEIEYNDDTELVLWGAGKKAKEVAKRLIDRKIKFTWISNSERKTGLHIYGVLLVDQNDFTPSDRHKIIIAVSAPADQKAIQAILDQWSVEPGKNYWWFC